MAPEWRRLLEGNGGGSGVAEAFKEDVVSESGGYGDVELRSGR